MQGYHNLTSQDSPRKNLKPSDMYGCSAGIKQATISKIKVIVHASSFQLLSLASIAFSSHDPSCSTFFTCA